MADRITDIILVALRRAVREPGLPLIANRKTAGLFPATALGRQAAQSACADNLLEARPDQPESFSLTEAGRTYLAAEAHPREILEDIARAVESRGSQLAGWIDAATALRAEWQKLRALINQVVNGEPPSERRLDDEACEILGTWTASGDCPLPELYRRLVGSNALLTVGAFHDCLRQLHADQRIYLHPWTGPLYRLPEPDLAILAGHEVAYYASPRLDQVSKPFQNSTNETQLQRASA